MSTIECKAEVAVSAADAIGELLAELAEPRWMVLEDKLAGRAWIAGYFASRAEADAAWRRMAGALDPAWRAGRMARRELADADWRDSYKAHFKAWQFGRLHWVPVWEKESCKLRAGDEAVWLDPGMAFGTGNHETTRLAVERLVEFAERRGTGRRVIDAGCGSGILAISAAKLGFKQVRGFDHDPEAVRVSAENAALNGLAGQAKFFTGDLATGFGGRRADFVMANILADVLAQFARELTAAVAPGGELVLSGILAGEVGRVRAAFAGAARDWPADSRTLGEWADLRLCRPR